MSESNFPSPNGPRWRRALLVGCAFSWLLYFLPIAFCVAYILVFVPGHFKGFYERGGHLIDHQVNLYLVGGGVLVIATTAVALLRNRA